MTVPEGAGPISDPVPEAPKKREGGRLTTSPVDFGEGIAIAFATATAYLVAFFFQQGYLGYYEVPWSLIDVDIASMAAALLSLTVLALLLLFLADIAYSSFSFASSRIRARITFWFVILLLFLFDSILRDELGRPTSIIAILLVLLAAILNFVLPYLLGIPGDTYEEKWLNSQRPSGASNNLLGALFSGSRVLVLGVRCAFIAAFLIYEASVLGAYHARAKVKYLVPSESSGAAVIGIRGNLVILVRFDPETKHLRQGFYVKGLGDEGAVGFSYSRIGPLVRRMDDNDRANPAGSRAAAATPSHVRAR